MTSFYKYLKDVYDIVTLSIDGLNPFDPDISCICMLSRITRHWRVGATRQ